MDQRRSASPASGTVSRARKLQKRSARYDAGLFLAEGPQAVREALNTGSAQELFVSPDAALRFPDLVSQAQATGCLVIDVDDRTLASISDTVNPQGLVAVSSLHVTQLEQIAQVGNLLVVLVEARDPGNIGTIIRIADAAGADGVLLTADSVDPFNSKSVRSSAGSVFHLPLVVGVSTYELADQARSNRITLVGATGDAQRSLFDLRAADVLRGRIAWLFGNEAHGLPQAARDLCDTELKIPIFGRAESLNIAAAAAVCLYESARLRR